MGRGRLRDNNRQKTISRLRRYSSIALPILRSRSIDPSCAVGGNAMLLSWAAAVQNHQQEKNRYELRRRSITLHSFVEHRLPLLTDHVCLTLFRFRRIDLQRMTRALAWPPTSSHTSRNRYGVCPILSACVVLRRMASPARWHDLETLFHLHTSHLSEIFWESLERFVAVRAPLIMHEMHAPFWASRFQTYSASVHAKTEALENCVGFIDGTVIKVARPGGDSIQQQVCYNGHKRTHALKFQVVSSPCGLAIHLAGPMEGRRHDWTLYLSSGVEEQLPEVLNVDGQLFCIYGDSGYGARWYLYIPFRGSNLCEARRKFNEAMSMARVTVEWFFKEVKLYWTSVDFKRKLRINESGVSTMYIAAVLLTNFRNCVYPNSISQYFEVEPPSLEEYLNHKD